MKLRPLAKHAVLGALAFLGGLTGQVLSHDSAHATPREESPYAVVSQLGRVLAIVENDYVDPVERQRLLTGAIKGMVAELDAHSAYMPAEDFTVFESDTEGKFGGIGVEVDLRGDVVTIIAPIEGSPAERAGIKSGDRIIAVDGESVDVIGLDKMVRKMRGDPGTKVKLSVRREGSKDPLSFERVREIIRVSSVTGRVLEGNVAYLRVKQFQERTHEEMLTVVGKLRSENGGRPFSGVLFDMRSNPGGLVDQAAEVADEFLASGAIYSIRHRGQIVDQVSARGGGAFADVPVVVLVNEWSASAAELVAGALRDHDRATIVGAETFGKGSVQTILELPNGAGMRLTTARYYTPAGRAVQADGIHPHIVIDDAKPAAGLPKLRERDLQNHLSAEHLGPPLPPAQHVAAPADAPPTETSPSSDVPRDPTKGKDFVLKVGYETLRAKMSAK
jgi:carboxyl-terminal processing protease